MKSAKKLAAFLRGNGWKPGQPIHTTEGFSRISEACGCDLEGHMLEGKKSTLHLGSDPDGYGIRDLFENLVVNRSDGEPVGASYVQEYFNPQFPGRYQEAGMAAVDYSAFAGITGQLMVTMVMEPFAREEFKFRKMVTTHPSPLEEEKFIGIATCKDPGKSVTRAVEGQPLNYIGFGEEYVQAPLTVKEQLGIAVTKEAIFYDRTGQMTERANQVGYLLALSEEKETIGVLIGGTSDPIYFKEKRQFDPAPVTLDLYQEAGAGSGTYQLAYTYPSRPYPYVNDIPDNPLQDYTSIRTADQAYSNTVDPNTGEPIVVGKPFVIAPETKRMDLFQTLGAEMQWKLTQSGFTDPGAIVTTGQNVLSKIGLTADQFVTSRQLKAQLVAQLGLTAAQADLVWFYGDIAEAFRYVVNWPITVTQSISNSEAEFSQDIVMRFKASERGAAAVINPRYVVKCTG
jgi:hypothetical protein